MTIQCVNIHYACEDDSMNKRNFICSYTVASTIVYHKSFEAEKFHGFCAFSHVHKTYLYENSRWRCSSKDFGESMSDCAKVFCKSLHV